MALRTIKRIPIAPGVEVRVRRDSDWKEYRIESVYDGKVRESQTGYTDDREDAMNTSDEVATWHRRQPGYGRSNPRRKTRSNPAAKLPKSQIEFVVRKMHAGSTDAEVKAEMERRLRDAPPAWTPAIKRQAIAYALKVHAKNRKMYSDVLSGRIRSNPGSGIAAMYAKPMTAAQRKKAKSDSRKTHAAFVRAMKASGARTLGSLRPGTRFTEIGNKTTVYVRAGRATRDEHTGDPRVRFQRADSRGGLGVLDAGMWVMPTRKLAGPRGATLVKKRKAPARRKTTTRRKTRR